MKLPKSGLEVKLRDSITYGQMQDLNDCVLEGAKFDADGTPTFTDLHVTARKKKVLTMTIFVEKFGESDGITEKQINELEFEDGKALEDECTSIFDEISKKK